MRVTVIESPLAALHLTAATDVSSEPATVRQADETLTAMLVAEASRELVTVPIEVSSVLGPAHGRIISEPMILVALLPGGLTLLSAALRMLDTAKIAFLDQHDSIDGYRLESIAPRIDGSHVFLLASHLSAIPFLPKVINRLLGDGASRVSLLSFVATHEKVVELESFGDNVELIVTTMDADKALAIQTRADQ